MKKKYRSPDIYKQIKYKDMNLPSPEGFIFLAKTIFRIHFNVKNFTFEDKYHLMKINSLQIEIDGIDKEILRYLMEDARKPILQIAAKIGISGAAIHQRLRKLEQAGVIAGSKFIVDTKVLGYSTMAFIGIYLDKASSNPEAVKDLKKIPEVLECHYTTGNWSILIKVICRDNEHLMQLLNDKIQPISGVSRTETFISLQQQLERQIQL
jgi:Lrp/AsnC family transcriptional regulator for asnA, asnC and gidA